MMVHILYCSVFCYNMSSSKAKFPGLDLNTAIILVTLGYKLTELQTCVLLQVKDEP